MTYCILMGEHVVVEHISMYDFMEEKVEFPSPSLTLSLR